MLANYIQAATQGQTCTASDYITERTYVTLSYDLNNYYSLLSHISQDTDQRWILFIAPPGRPNITFLQQAGVHKNRIICLPQSKITNHCELLKKMLKSGNYATVVTWLNDCSSTLQTELNNLAEQADSSCFIYCTQ